MSRRWIYVLVTVLWLKDAVAGLVYDGQAGIPVRLVVDRANVRAQPSTRAEVIMTLTLDARVLLLQVRKL